jgi:hypothetical protein
MRRVRAKVRDHGGRNRRARGISHGSNNASEYWHSGDPNLFNEQRSEQKNQVGDRKSEQAIGGLPSRFSARPQLQCEDYHHGAACDRNTSVQCAGKAKQPRQERNWYQEQGTKRLWEIGDIVDVLEAWENTT